MVAALLASFAGLAIGHVHVGLNVLPLVMAVSCVLIGTMPAILKSMRRNFDFFEPIHLIAGYSALTYGVRGVYLLLYGRDTYLPFATDKLISTGLMLAILGILAIYLGYHSRVGDKIASLFPPPRYLSAEGNYPIIVVVFGLLFGFD